MTKQRRKNSAPAVEEVVRCASCGEKLERGQKHKTESRIVRPGNKYDGAVAGSVVEIEPRHLHGAALLATMSMQEHLALLEVAVKPAVPKKGRLAEMVEKGLASATAETKAAIERGKAALERARQRAIAAGEDLPREAVGVDAESIKAPATVSG